MMHLRIMQYTYWKPLSSLSDCSVANLKPAIASRARSSLQRFWKSSVGLYIIFSTPNDYTRKFI